jgi:ABC-type lipoprotein export system ATPase subunit
MEGIVREQQVTDGSDISTTPAQTDAAILQVEDVIKIYSEGPIESVALRGATLRVAPGEFVALLGRSGSGKSTLLNLIAGNDTPSAGRIWVSGQDITQLSESARSTVRCRTLGFVFQANNMMPFLSARENVELPIRLNGASGAAARRRAEELLELVGLRERLHHHASQLSGGEAQRVGIACALANQPLLVLADELTGELDSASTAAILDLLITINRTLGTAFLVVTHNHDVAQRAGRILRIRDGIVAEDAHG